MVSASVKRPVKRVGVGETVNCRSRWSPEPFTKALNLPLKFSDESVLKLPEGLSDVSGSKKKVWVGSARSAHVNVKFGRKESLPERISVPSPPQPGPRIRVESARTANGIRVGFRGLILSLLTS